MVPPSGDLERPGEGRAAAAKQTKRAAKRGAAKKTAAKTGAKKKGVKKKATAKKAAKKAEGGSSRRTRDAGTERPVDGESTATARVELSEEGLDARTADQLAALGQTFVSELGRGLVDRRLTSETDPARVGVEAARWVLARYSSGHPMTERVGAVYSTGDLARWLTSDDRRHLTREAVRKRTKQRQLVAFRTDDRQWAYPAWQFDVLSGRLQPHSHVVALWQQLPHEMMDGADLVVWMATRLRDLDATPYERARTHGMDDEALTGAVARLRARAHGAGV